MTDLNESISQGMGLGVGLAVTGLAFDRFGKRKPRRRRKKRR